jgi:hypothetical protein
MAEDKNTHFGGGSFLFLEKSRSDLQEIEIYVILFRNGR